MTIYPQPWVYLSELVRAAGGQPFDLVAVARLLDLADEVLPDGRYYTGPLTAAELESLGFTLEQAPALKGARENGCNAADHPAP